MYFTSKIKMPIRKRLKFAASLIVGSLALTGCLVNLESPQLPPAAYVSIFQGSTAAPAMDVFANQNRVNQSPLTYSQIIPYSAFFTGTRDFRFSAFNSATALLEKNFVLKADSVYSIFVADKAAGIDAILIKDIWKDPVAEKSQLRFVHLSSDTEPVYLEISGSTNPLIPESSFKAISDFKEVNKGNYTLRVKSKETNAILIQTGTLEIQGNRVYSLILRGLSAESTGDKKLDLQLVTNYINY
ncbi:DUF4397 domain-containing protein [Algoriphagus sp.]|uniref:DUF4397 domain-containing protein n=1 Tax=Algoriphagus sp. TaxID=1872435 RepID=UPI00391D1600